MTSFKELQDAHLALLARQDAQADDPGLVADAQRFISEATTASTWVGDTGDRDLLRAYLRYWAGFIYERTGVFPRTELRPAETGPAIAPDGGEIPQPLQPYPDAAAPRRAASWLGLLVIGGLLLLAAAVIFALLRNGDTGVGPGVTPTIPPLISRTPSDPAELPFAAIDERNAADATQVAAANGHTGAALAVAFDPTGGELASAGADGVARFWGLPDLARLAELPGQNSWLRTLAYGPAGGNAADSKPGTATALFLTGGNDRIVRLYDRNTLLPFSQLGDAAGFIFDARFSPDGRFVAAGGGDGVTRVWDVATGAPVHTLQARGDGAAVVAVAYSPGGDQLATGVVTTGGSATDDDDNNEGGLQLWDAATGAWQCGIGGAAVTALTYRPDGGAVAAGSEGGDLFFVDPRSCRVLGAVEAHDGPVGGVAYSPGGDWLVTGGDDGTVKVWSGDWQLLATLNAGRQAAAVESVAISPAAQFIAAGDANGGITLWGVAR